MKILIIEDDQSVAELERDYLEINGGFQCDLYTDGTQGLQAALAGDYALVIVDVMLPGLSGFEICRRLREVKDTPVIISALADDIDKVRGLGLGADDYMTKPFSPSELVARVKGHIQRYQRLVGSREKARPEMLKVRGLEIDRESRRVWVNGKETNMTSKEYDLLLFLAEHPDTVFSKDRLFDSVWGVDAYGDVSTVTVHIKHIRDKIELNPDRTQYIETVWGGRVPVSRLICPRAPLQEPFPFAWRPFRERVRRRNRTQKAPCPGFRRAGGWLFSKGADGNVRVLACFLDLSDLDVVVVAVADMDADPVAHLMAQQGLSHRGLLADEAFEGVLAEGGDQLDGLFGLLLFQVKGDFVKQGHPVPGGGAVDDHGGLDHVLQIANAAVVAVLLPFGGFVLKIFTEIAKGAGHLDLLNELGAEDLNPVLELFLHFVNVNLGQFVVHDHTPLLYQIRGDCLPVQCHGVPEL